MGSLAYSFPLSISSLFDCFFSSLNLSFFVSSLSFNSSSYFLSGPIVFDFFKWECFIACKILLAGRYMLDLSEWSYLSYFSVFSLPSSFILSVVALTRPIFSYLSVLFSHSLSSLSFLLSFYIPLFTSFFPSLASLMVLAFSPPISFFASSSFSLFTNFYLCLFSSYLILSLYSLISFFVYSFDVIHSFGYHSFGFKSDAIPGRVNLVSSLSLFFNGYFISYCYELCGLSHSSMLSSVIVLS